MSKKSHLKSKIVKYNFRSKTSVISLKWDIFWIFSNTVFLVSFLWGGTYYVGYLLYRNRKQKKKLLPYVQDNIISLSRYIWSSVLTMVLRWWLWLWQRQPNVSHLSLFIGKCHACHTVFENHVKSFNCIQHTRSSEAS